MPYCFFFTETQSCYFEMVRYLYIPTEFVRYLNILNWSFHYWFNFSCQSINKLPCKLNWFFSINRFPANCRFIRSGFMIISLIFQTLHCTTDHFTFTRLLRLSLDEMEIFIIISHSNLFVEVINSSVSLRVLGLERRTWRDKA